MKTLNKNIFTYILSIIIVITLIIDTIFFRDLDRFLKTIGVIFLIYLYYFLNLKLKLPIFISGVVNIHIFLTLFLGAIYNFYSIFWWWDLLVHWLFGFVAFISAYYLIVRLGYDKCLSHFMILFIGGMTAMGCAAIWEIVEYTLDKVFGTNFQHGIVEVGYPLDDTMWDMIVTLIAVIISFILYWIDLKFNKAKVQKWLKTDFLDKKSVTE